LGAWGFWGRCLQIDHQLMKSEAGGRLFPYFFFNPRTPLLLTSSLTKCILLLYFCCQWSFGGLEQGGGRTWIPNQGWEGGGVWPKAQKKKVTPAILILMVSYTTSDGSDNDNEEPKDLTRPILPSIPASQSDATLKGGLEDAISAESQCEPISLVLINAVNQCRQDKLPKFK